MIFLNLILAGGLVAVGAPIVIHLLHRSRVEPHDWGAMMFLEELMAERARRLRMQELLLLIVRALIVACLALALMRPAISSPSAGLRSAAVHTSAVVLLDDSYSMNCGRNHTAWDDAREQALKYIDTLQNGDDVSIMFTSSAGKVPQPAALFDHDRVREIIRNAHPRYDKTDMPRAITAALQQLESQHNPRRELVLFSDMQAAGWELNDNSRWSFLSSAVRSARVKPNIILAATPDTRPLNVALTNITTSRQVIDAYSPVAINVTITNQSSTQVNDATVSFVVDGATKANRSVKLAANAQEIITFEHQFGRPGSHYVACNLRCSEDMLDDDNSLSQSLLVIDRLPVLLVDGDRRDGALSSETAYLKLALSPQDGDDPMWRTVIETTVIDTSDLRYTDFSKYRVVVLANVAALPATVVSQIERFVVAGGGLMIALGDRVHPEIYNRDLFRQGAGLLPVALKSMEGESRADRNSASPMRLVSTTKGEKSDGVRLASIVSNAPALDLFRPEKGQDWSRARLRAWFATAAPGEGARVLAQYSNADAALVQKQLGEGKVLLLTTAVDLDWSDLPVHPFYVPLVQNLVFDLASAVIPPRNIPVGQTLTHVAAGTSALKPHVLFSPTAPGTSELDLTKPATLKMQRQGQLSIFNHEETRIPGLYAVSPEGGATDERVYYSIAAERSESVLARLEDEDQQKLQRDLGAHIAKDWDGLAHLLQLDAGSFEISKYMIMAAIFFCFVEVYLTRRWT
jgi:hypothetical protein